MNKEKEKTLRKKFEDRYNFNEYQKETEEYKIKWKYFKASVKKMEKESGMTF